MYRRRDGGFLRIVWSVAFIMVGFFLLLYPQIEKRISENKEQELIEAFEQIAYIEEPVINTSTKETSKDRLDDVRGVIRIPKIDLEMPIIDGATHTALNKGVGMIEPEKEFGINNIGLAGHRSATYGKQFNRLDELSPNDEIQVKTKKGSYTFVISKTFVVHRTEVEVIADKHEPLVTLVTCTPIGEEDPIDRLIVQAKLKSKG